jgi:apolipoprotein N-acyltransferase
MKGTKRRRPLLAGLAMAAYLLAFHGAAPLIVLAPGLLWLALHGLSSRQAFFWSALWGVVMEGLFHLWALASDPLLWLCLLPARGLLWMFFMTFALLPLGGSAWKRALSCGAGLCLVTLLLLLGPSGLDWETPAAALADWPWLLSTLPWLGLPGLSFLLGLLSQPLLAGDKRAAGLAAAGLALWLAVSALLLSPQRPWTLPVALLQTGWEEDEKWAPRNREAAKDRLLEMTEQAHDRGARMVVWPETAWPVMSLRQLPLDSRAISALARRLKVEVLVSSLEVVPEGWHNSVTQVLSSGRFAFEYHKRRLLPFEEYLPLPGWLVGALESRGWVPPGCHYVAGGQDVVFSTQGRRFAVMICYESTVPWAFLRLSERVDFFVVTTNDAALRSGFAREAHFRSAVLRAAQTRRPVLQVGNTGVSGLIDNRGAVVVRSDPALAGPQILSIP